jgi:hypothetical protein
MPKNKASFKTLFTQPKMSKQNCTKSYLAELALIALLLPYQILKIVLQLTTNDRWLRSVD